MDEHEGGREREARPSVDALQEFLARVRAPTSSLTAELDAAAVEALDALAAKSVKPLLLKGPALAQLLYKPGEQRAYSDVDLLVAPADLPAARAALASLGYRNASAALGIDDVGGAVHEENWIDMRPGSRQLVIELHLRLAGSKAPAAAAWDALQRRRTSVELQGRPVSVLDRDGLAMHLALHAAQHGPRYEKTSTELMLGLERWPLEVWEGAARLAEEVGATETFAAGLRLVPPGVELAEALGLPEAARVDWEIRQTARPRGTFHVDALREARGLRERTSVLRRSLFRSRRWILWEFPWAHKGPLRFAAAYALHLARTPVWVARAWWFGRRSRARRRQK